MNSTVNLAVLTTSFAYNCIAVTCVIVKIFRASFLFNWQLTHALLMYIYFLKDLIINKIII